MRKIRKGDEGEGEEEREGGREGGREGDVYKRGRRGNERIGKKE